MPHRLSPAPQRAPHSEVRVGVHVSIAGGLTAATERAHGLGCRAMQIFSKSPRGWAAKPLDPSDTAMALAMRKELDVGPLAVHASYLLNLASADDALYGRSVIGLIEELERCALIGADFLVLHVGCTRPAQTDGITRVRDALRDVLHRRAARSLRGPTQILLENTAGERGEVGSRFEELAEILDGVRSDRLGVCLDTCHTLAAGYEYRTADARDALLAKIDGTIGLRAVKLLHVNDSKKGLGSRVDRHEHIGRGEVGPAGFRALLTDVRVRGIPMVLETPKNSDADDRRNLAAIRRLATPTPASRPGPADGAVRASAPARRTRRRP